LPKADSVLPVPFLEILAFEQTDLGTLCLRRRRLPIDDELPGGQPEQWVTEITLNHEFLMSSRHTDSEQALARLAIERLSGTGHHVLIGGLGLGYTAHAALAYPQVQSLVVLEYLPQVVDWLRGGLVPLSSSLNDEPRLTVRQSDVYAYLLGAPVDPPLAAILIDVDHSPADPLNSSSGQFYTVTGLNLAKRHLGSKGILALWSYAEHSPTFEALQQVFRDVEAVPITYYNHHVQQSYTDWLYLAQDR